MLLLNTLHITQPNGRFSVITLPNAQNHPSASCLLSGHRLFISFVDFSSSVSSLNMHFLYSSVPAFFSLCKWSPSSNWVLPLLSSPSSSQALTSHLHSVTLSHCHVSTDHILSCLCALTQCGPFLWD